MITELPLSGPVGGGFFKNGLDGITLGSNNKLAFTESTQGALGNITTSGSYNQIPIDSTGKDTGQEPDQITKSSDGTLWFTEDGAMAIGELTTSGVFHGYTVPNATNGGIIGPSLKGITVGSDGNIWFTNWGSSGDFIGMMTPSGTVTEFSLPFGTSPVGITSGPDGNLWFTAYGSNMIDVMSTSGTILHQYPVPGGSLAYITVGSDGNLYFTEQTGDIGEITTGGVVTITPVSTTVTTVPGASGPQPLAITGGPDGNIWFTDPWTDSIGVLRFVTAPTPTPIPTPTSPTPTPTLPIAPTPPPTPTPTSPTPPRTPPPGKSPTAPTSGPHQTKTLLTAKPRPATIGRTVAIAATVESVRHGGGTPIGDVTFYDGTTVLESDVALKGGKATLKTSSLTVGPHRIWVQYVGSEDFEGSHSSVLTEKIRAGRSKRLVSAAGFLVQPSEGTLSRPEKRTHE